MKRIIIIILTVICFLLVSTAYFLWIYEQEGFLFTVRCLFVWGFCLTSYTVMLGGFFLLIDDFL